MTLDKILRQNAYIIKKIESLETKLDDKKRNKNQIDEVFLDVMLIVYVT